MPIERSVALIRHPSTPSAAVAAVRVDVRRSATALALAFRLDGDVARIRVPPLAAPRIGDDLWRRTCFESFLAAPRLTGYHELNFSPSREWTLYEFRGYRDGAAVADEARAPLIDVRIGTHHLELDARISLDRLSPAHASADLRIGLAAVVEANDGTVSYWAIRHPAGKPDFHHAEGFALWLEPPRLEY